MMADDYSKFFLGQDLDWFATDYENTVGHFASGGGRLPMSILQEFEPYSIVVPFFRSLPEIDKNELIVNPLLDQIISFPSDESRERYLSSFIFMAKRGIFSYDKNIVMNISDDYYHIVVRPSNPILLEMLPLEISLILKNTRFGGTFLNSEGINLDQIS